MQHGQQGGAGPEEALVVIIGSVVILGGGLFALWWFCQAEIVAVVLTVQHWLMAPAHLVTDRYLELDRQIQAVDAADPTITVGALAQLTHDVGAFWRIPGVLLIAGLAVLCARRTKGRYKRKLNLRGLMREQAKHYPVILPFVRRNLGPVVPAEGAPRPADPALHAGEWIARFARDKDQAFNADLLRAELGRQLGPLWTGVADAEPHVRVLFAAFALFGARRRDEAMELLGAMAASLPDGRGEGPEGPTTPLEMPTKIAARADVWLRDPAIAGPCVKLAAQHAYTHPALMSVLSYARQRSGVLNPGLFAFVQLLNRRLFLALDSLGVPVRGQPWHRSASQAPYVEAAGAREHWTAELEAREPLLLPVIDGAASTLSAVAAKG